MTGVALITGGSSGIGLATARLLRSRGYRVALVARSADRLNEVAADLNALALPCDVADIDALPDLVSATVDAYGSLDVLVNNAGVHYRGSMLRHTPQQLAQMVMVNTAAPIALTRAAAEVMQPGSVVVNVASLAGKLPLAGAATYSGSKAGVRFWAMAAAEDLAERGIRMATVNPGPVDTGFFDEDLEHVTPMTFSQPMSTVEQCAQAVLKAIEADVEALDAALAESADFNALIQSPIYSRDEQGTAIAAIAAKMGLSETMINALALMASKRRLFVLPQLVATLRAAIAEDKGEVTADVISAKALTKAQADKLAKTLKASVGKDVNIKATVDESLIGGLVVKVGSKMIDSSIRSRLNALQNSMKEV